MLIGHRGYSAKFPENSMLAFRNVSTKMIEFDVRKTKDNIPIVIHDSTLERTTTGSGSVKEYSFEDLQKMSIKGSARESEYEKIPSLEQVFREFGSEYAYDIEIKSHDTAHLIVDAIKKSGIPYDNFLVTSFKWEEIEALRKLDSNIFTGLISVIRPARAIRRCKNIGCKVVVLNHRVISREIVKFAADRNIHVYAYTINTTEEMKRLFGYGVQAIITDNPNIMW
jgi:glycerophosphoryl diester phosphodiesterase